jgi:sortase A
MMLLTVALAATVAAVVNLTSPTKESASQAASIEPMSPQSTPQDDKKKKNKEFDPGKKLELPNRSADGEPSSGEPEDASQPAQALGDSPQNWPDPSGDEVAATQAPRYYPQRQDGVMTLTVDALGLYDVPVIDAATQQALDEGVIHLPQTPMPWEERPQKNVYLAGHRLGWPGTGSRLVFYNLDKLEKGDTVVLKDSLGEPYEYRVSEVFVAKPDADWAEQPVRGRDMVTLQTCTFPDLQNRLIVRADKL